MQLPVDKLTASIGGLQPLEILSLGHNNRREDKNMIFADKLILLRKKAGWSQEELAEQMNVTRQSVSKWEGAQSIPDLEKIIKLSQLFGVSTDYLLKENIEIEENVNISDTLDVRTVSLGEANEFLEIKEAGSKLIALAVSLFILSPIVLLILGQISESNPNFMNENVASGIGLIVLFILVAAGVGLLVVCGNQSGKYDFLDKEVIETAYGVRGLAKEKQENYRDTYNKLNLTGIMLCVTSVIPIFIGVIIDDNNDILSVIMLAVTLLLIATGVYFLVRAGVRWGSYEKLLQEGDYTKVKKANSSLKGTVYTSFWLVATSIYLLYSFLTNAWDISWIVMLIAGILFPIVIAITNLFSKKNNE